MLTQHATAVACCRQGVALLWGRSKGVTWCRDPGLSMPCFACWHRTVELHTDCMVAVPGSHDEAVASGEGAVRQAPEIARFCLPKSLVDGLPEYCRGRA